MKNSNLFKMFMCLVTFIPLSFFAMANQEDKEQAQVSENEVVIKVAFEVTEQFSGLSETASTKKQMLIPLDEWQEVQLDRYTIKFKISLSATAEKQFMVDTQILNRQNTPLYSPSVMAASNKSAGIKISAKTPHDPAFNVGFTVLSE